MSGSGIPIPTEARPNHNAGDELCAVLWVLFGTASLVGAVRAYSKVVVLKRVGADDMVMLLSWVYLRSRMLQGKVAHTLTLRIGLHIGVYCCSSAFISFGSRPPLRIPQPSLSSSNAQVGLRCARLLYHRACAGKSLLHPVSKSMAVALIGMKQHLSTALPHRSAATFLMKALLCIHIIRTSSRPLLYDVLHAC